MTSDMVSCTMRCGIKSLRLRRILAISEVKRDQWTSHVARLWDSTRARVMDEG